MGVCTCEPSLRARGRVTEDERWKQCDGRRTSLFMDPGWEGTRLTASSLFVCILCLQTCVCLCAHARANASAHVFTSGADLTAHCLPPGGWGVLQTLVGRLSLFLRPGCALASPASCSAFCTRTERKKTNKIPAHACGRAALKKKKKIQT